MYSIFKIFGITTLVFIVAAGVYIFYTLTISHNPSTQQNEPDRDFFPTGVDSPDKADGAVVPQDRTPAKEPEEPINPFILQGGTAPILPHQVDQLREIILVSQEVPARAIGERWYFVASTPMHTTHVVVIPDGSAYVDVILNQAPYTMSRMYAESEFAQLFNGERDDLCGFPFNIHVDSDPLLKERGNLGLEYCGANMLEENE